VDFSKLKSIDLKSFNAIMDWLEVFRISGKKVAIYGIMPHIAALLATYNVSIDFKILRHYDEKW
jgi:ABC-type transporter Mla MlaB component